MTITAQGSLPIMLQTIDDKEKKRMPSVSKDQQAVMAIARHDPARLFKRNRGVLKMSGQQLDEFASTPTKNLPKKVRAGKRIFAKK